MDYVWMYIFYYFYYLFEILNNLKKNKKESNEQTNKQSDQANWDDSNAINLLFLKLTEIYIEHSPFSLGDSGWNGSSVPLACGTKPLAYGVVLRMRSKKLSPMSR